MERTPTFQVQAFGNYYLLERIAVGGMAEIFKAKQIGVRGFEKIVVIKRILQHLGEDPEFVEMFEDEAKLAAQLTQANIVQIFELGEVDETLYITMEYIDGKNLRDLTRAAGGRGIQLSVEQVVMILIEVLKGLDYAHRKTDSSGQPLHIIHRDISPQNIILSYEGEVKILDFGIAKAASKISKTEAGVLKGKFSYMSPEQASGKPIDQTSDVYAAGVIFHELLTGERLFRSKTDLETLDRVKEGKVEPPSLTNPLIPTDIDRITLKALSKNLEERYKSAGEMLSDLTRFSFDNQFNFSGQDLSIFMQTLFAESIREEKSRLLDALGQIPQNPSQQLQNARTHIAFKRVAIESPTESPKETTFTGRVSEPTSLQTRRFRLILILVVIGALGLFVLNQKQQPSSPVTSEPGKQQKPNEGLSLIIPPDESKPVSPRLSEILNRDENSENPPKILESENSDFPSPRKIEPSPKPNIKPKQMTSKKAEPAPVEAKPIVIAPKNATINVIAPPQGYAKLFINKQERGTVPGPNAKNISLPPGTHDIRCESTTKTFEGKITVKEDETLTVKCQNLKK